MGKQATLQVRIDATMKAEAEELFEALGLSLSEAVRLFVAKSVNGRRLPFTPHLSKSEGATSAFGKLRHYGNPAQSGDERTAWLKEQGSSDTGRPKAPLRGRSRDIVIVDKTILLHYLLDNDSRRSAKARRIIAGGAARAYPETIVACVAALENDYRVPRSLIGTVMALLADDVSMEDGAAVRLAARLYGAGKLSFAEHLLAARNILTGYPVETFSKPLSRTIM
ncbi:type II toxin-antitoxin system RelB/DinJ family antitoxin [Parvibacter caecicola]|uniref:type II toxin-antitoxin system RelB/DinJ family antitoxin n=1 Tax=Parvibacter caecicola TaxID=747645 RepID=UPI00248C295C|nr:type II toxin-antitoxin system RelB/DinJ family antitoxin [Parvibacter caecicola]